VTQLRIRKKVQKFNQSEF